MLEMIKKSILIFGFMAQSFSIASANDVDDEKIYFCTKDLDSLQPSPTSITGSNTANAGGINMQVYHPLKNDKHNILNLRHCFMLFGTLKKIEDNKLFLSSVTTFGYGGNPNPEQNKKTGGVYQEPDLENKVVSCVPVLEKSKLRNHEDIYDKWATVLRTMNKETKREDYHTLGHNCCSVAYKAVEAIGGNLSNIDHTNFNLYGLGINYGPGIVAWSNTLSSPISYLSGFFVKSVNFSSNSSSFNPNKENGLVKPLYWLSWSSSPRESHPQALM